MEHELMTARDRTCCRAVEDRLRLAHEKLRQADAALDSMSEGVIVADSSERIVSVNRAFGEITGFAADEVIGQTLRVPRSGQHNREVFAGMWRSIQDTGCWHGEVWNRRKDGRGYPALLTVSVVRDEAGSVSHYVGVLLDLSQMRDAAVHLDRLAHSDALTGLPNHLLFEARVDHAIAQAPRYRLAILVFDTNGFRRLNDSLGHRVGDDLLRRFGSRLHNLNRENNTVARVAGDEFGVLIEGVIDAASAGQAALNMMAGLSRPFEVEGREVYLTCAVGISVYPDDGTDFVTLLQNAQVALHRAKSSGNGGLEFYTGEMTQRAIDRFAIECDLRCALQRAELVLHYQPQFSLTSGAVTGVEALARWQHPERGLVAPGAFIPIAEEAGLIDSIGAWAVRQACAEAVTWPAEGLPPIRVAVNLSSREMANPHLVESVAAALRDTGLTPDQLELEITEGMLTVHPDAARATLLALKDLGVTLAIDDFGTGHSSLNALKLYPIDRLKIDRSFVATLVGRHTDQAIARAIITLGHGLSLGLVAEGVEIEEQADFLRENDCDEVQGYFYSPPLPPEALRDNLRIWATR